MTSSSTQAGMDLFIKIGLDEMDEHLAVAMEADWPVAFYGAPGIGKTTKAKTYARQRKALNPKAGLFFIEGGTANMNDLMGYLMEHEATYVGDDGEPITIHKGEYTFPFWAFDVDDGRPIFQCDEAYVVIDEFPLMDPAEQKAFASILLGKNVGLHKLPAGTRFIVLGNMRDNRSGAKKELAFIVNRMLRYHVLAKEDALMRHALAHGWQPIIRAFLKRHADVVLDTVVPESAVDGVPFCTPRSMDMCNAFTSVALKHGWKYGEPRMLVGMQAAIGVGPAKQLDTIAKLGQTLPRRSQIERDPDGTALPDEPSARYLLAFELANHTTHDTVEAHIRYIQRMEKSFHVCFLSSILSRDPDFYGHAIVGQWMLDNHELMAACGDLTGRRG